MKTRLEIGVQLPEIEREVGWPEMRDMAKAAEAVGLDSIWVGDHLLYRTAAGTVGPWEAWSTLAAIAAVTDRVKIGPLVAATSFHNPAMLAKKAVTIDEISGGRLILGLGAGWNQDEYEAFGYPFDHRASRFEEAFTIIRTLLRDGAIDFTGTYYTLRECELVPGARPGGPPLMVGSMGPRVLRTTLPYVELWNAWHAWFGNTPAGLIPLLGRVDELCGSVARDPADLVRTAAVMVEGPGGSGGLHGSPGRPQSRAIGGAPEDVAAELIGYADVGIGHIQVVIDPITVESIEWLGRVVAVLA